MSECGLSASGIEYTEKQRKLIDACNSVISKEGIKINIDPPFWEDFITASVDVEYDEAGNLVCIGTYDGREAVCFTRMSIGLKTHLEHANLVMHNGVSDIECLRMWGINVRDEQLIWDTMIIGHLLDSSLKSYGLKDMSKRELGIEYPSYDEIVGKHKGKTDKTPKCPQIEHDCCGRITLDKQPLELTSKYNCLDCYTTFRLYERQKKAMGL